jgi:hypothetical protein
VGLIWYLNTGLIEREREKKREREERESKKYIKQFLIQISITIIKIMNHLEIELKSSQLLGFG